MSTSKPIDDLEALRTVIEALQPLPTEDQRRLIRWAQEKLGLASGTTTSVPSSTPAAGEAPTVAATSAPASRDIRTFLQGKRPASDSQFATAVAYFYAFEAPEAQRLTEITGSNLQDAARLSGRARFARPTDTLHNAAKQGYLDKGQGRASFRINTVGENLVAMAMPGGPATATKIAATRRASGRKGRPPKKGNTANKRTAVRRRTTAKKRATSRKK